jgi:hypothetical protein
VAAFFTALLLFIGYTLGVGFFIVALLKPVFPNNVGFWIHNGFPLLGAEFPAPPGVQPMGGYAIMPICFVLGLAVLVGTHVAARRWVASVRERLKGQRAAGV